MVSNRKPGRVSEHVLEGAVVPCNSPGDVAHAGATACVPAMHADMKATAHTGATVCRPTHCCARRRNNDWGWRAITWAPALPSSPVEGAQPIAHASVMARTQAGAHYLLLPASHGQDCGRGGQRTKGHRCLFRTKNFAPAPAIPAIFKHLAIQSPCKNCQWGH